MSTSSRSIGRRSGVTRVDEVNSIVGAVLLAADAAEAAPFYSALFGWELCRSATGEVDLLVRGGVAEALVVATTAEVPGWAPVVAVESLVAASAAATRSGGSVRQLTETTVLVEDPFGASYLAIEPAGLDALPAPALRAYDPAQSEPGALSWCQLNSSEPLRSAEYYSVVFGWTLGRSDNDKFTYWRFHKGGPLAHAGLMAIDERSGRGVPGVWQIYFHGDGLDEAGQRVVDSAGSVLVPATDIVAGSFLVASDPTGHMLGIDRMTHGPVDTPS